VESFPGGVNIYCQLSNNPFPAPTLLMTAMSIDEDSTIKILNRKQANIFLNKTVLKTIFEDNTIVVNVSCRVSNSFGSDELTTLIRVCGECMMHSK
jgi:hypothetical protein